MEEGVPWTGREVLGKRVGNWGCHPAGQTRGGKGVRK